MNTRTALTFGRFETVADHRPRPLGSACAYWREQGWLVGDPLGTAARRTRTAAHEHGAEWADPVTGYILVYYALREAGEVFAGDHPISAKPFCMARSPVIGAIGVAHPGAAIPAFLRWM